MAAGLLSACGEGSVGKTLTGAVRYTFGQDPGKPVSRETIANLPYAYMAAKIGRGPRTVLVLWREENGDQHWLTADGVAIVTRGGRVVKTAGLPETLRDTRAGGVDPIAKGLHELATPVVFHRYIDVEPAQGYDLEIESRFDFVRDQQIVIAEIDFDTKVYHERNTAKTINWSFDNYYWVDPADGFVWKSTQHIGRRFPPIEIEILKPPA